MSKPSNAVIEDRTWQWFMGAVSRYLGPAFYDGARHPAHSDWPDIIAHRSRRTVCFEITSPLLPHDVNSGGKDNHELVKENPFTLRQRILDATIRKIHRYGVRHFSQPMALLITLAHPITQRLSRGDATVAGIGEELQATLAEELHQPFDAIYLIGPGPHAWLLWRRTGPKWKRVFPELDTATQKRRKASKSQSDT
ncbi:MAG: hypothetical protein V1784_02935 [bacterium]